MKVSQISAKAYIGVMSHDTEEWCKIGRKTALLFEFGVFWPKHSKVPALKSLKHLHFDWFLLCKVYNVRPKKNTEELFFMTLKSDTKFEEKLTCNLENDMGNLVNFHQSTWKSQNLDFDGILLSKLENVWA